MYILNKNNMAVFSIFMYGFWSNFSASFFYNSLNYQIYSVVYTAVPIILFANFDRDVPREEVLLVPELYAEGSKGHYFGSCLILLSIAEGLISAAVCLLSPLALGNGLLSNGLVLGIRGQFALIYFLIIFNSNIKIFYLANRISLGLVVSVFMGILFYFPVVLTL